MHFFVPFRNPFLEICIAHRARMGDRPGEAGLAGGLISLDTGQINCPVSKVLNSVQNACTRKARPIKDGASTCSP